jgi:perosamine synthetase
MKSIEEKLFCGFPDVGVGEILGSKRMTNDWCAWFWDAQLFLTHTGKTAIRKACELINIEPGDEVLMPSYNCGSEIDAIIKGGATVVLYRVDRSSMIDVDDLRLRINRRTKAVYVTYYFGFPQQIGKIKEICEANSIYLIEDCALSLFSSNGPEKLGSTGDIAIISLTKALPVPDGGVLVVNNPNLMKELWNLRPPNQTTIYRSMLPLIKSRVMRLLSSCRPINPLYRLIFGMLKWIKGTEQNRRYLNQGKRLEMSIDMYYDERLSNRGLSGLSKRIFLSCDVDHIISTRRDNYETLLYLLKECDRIKPLFGELPPGTCPLFFPVIVDNRNELAVKMNELGIDARAFWKGYHGQLPWEDFPDACFLKDNLLALPIHQELSRNNIEYIAENMIRLKGK